MELSPEEDNRQVEMLKRIRSKHHQALVSEGVAQRILSDNAPINQRMNRKPLTEGTLFFVLKKALTSTAIGEIWGSGSLSDDSPNLPQDLNNWFEMFSNYPEADVLVLSRYEPQENGFTMHAAFVGVRLDDKQRPNTLFPVGNISVEDLAYVGGLANELADLRKCGQLTCLSENLVFTL